MSGPDLDASPAAIRAAAPIWERQADDLTAAGQRLGGLDQTGFGPRVQPALEAFVNQWQRNARRRGTQARLHSEQLREMSSTYVRLDHEAAADLRTLLPWPGTEPYRPLTLNDPFGLSRPR